MSLRKIKIKKEKLIPARTPSKTTKNKVSSVLVEKIPPNKEKIIEIFCIKVKFEVKVEEIKSKFAIKFKKETIKNAVKKVRKKYFFSEKTIKKDFFVFEKLKKFI